MATAKRELDKDVDVSLRAQHAAERVRVSGRLHRVLDIPQPAPRHGLHGWIDRHFLFPKGELAIVAENGSKISLPTPLLGALIALFVWLAGGTLAGVWLVATMSANVSNLSNQMIQYQIRSDAERESMQKRLDLQQVYITDLREKLIEVKAQRRSN